MFIVLLFVSILLWGIYQGTIGKMLRKKQKIRNSMSVFDRQLERAERNYHVPHDKIEEERTFLLQLMEEDASSMKASAELRSFIEDWKINYAKNAKKHIQKDNNSNFSDEK